MASFLAVRGRRRWWIGGLILLNALAVTVLVALWLTPQPPRDSGPLPTLGGMTSVSRIEPLFSRVAGQLVGRKIEVRCWSAVDWARLSHEASVFTHGRNHLHAWGGYAAYDHKLVSLSPRVCHQLGLLAYRGLGAGVTYYDAYWLAWSLKVLAESTYQLARTRNSAKAECYAMQSIATTAASLGLNSSDAYSLARLYWLRIYPGLQPRYRSDECVNGGKLDLWPNSDGWPAGTVGGGAQVATVRPQRAGHHRGVARPIQSRRRTLAAAMPAVGL